MSEWTRGSRLTELTEDECWRLLRERQVGRVAYDDGGGPVILPLNYVVADGGRVRFRTAPHSTLGTRVDDRRVAFEVDVVDEDLATGWSVLVRGRASLVETDLHPLDEPAPTAWPAGARPLVVEISVDTITGRRLTPRGS